MTKPNYCPKFSFEPLLSNPDYKEPFEKREARMQERAALRAERETLLERIRNDRPSSDDEELRRIAALAAGKSYEKTPADRQQLEELNRKIVDLDRAIDFLRGQMDRAAQQHSTKVCASLREFHDELVANCAAQVIAAQQSAQRFRAFLEKLNDEGILIGSFPNGVEPSFLEAGSPYGSLAVWLNKIAKDGFIKRKALPPELDFHAG